MSFLSFGSHLIFLCLIYFLMFLFKNLCFFLPWIFQRSFSFYSLIFINVVNIAGFYSGCVECLFFVYPLFFFLFSENFNLFLLLFLNCLVFYEFILNSLFFLFIELFKIWLNNLIPFFIWNIENFCWIFNESGFLFNMLWFWRSFVQIWCSCFTWSF